MQGLMSWVAQKGTNELSKELRHISLYIDQSLIIRVRVSKKKQRRLMI